MSEIPLLAYCGPFAEDKDIARDLRLDQLIPLLEARAGPVVLDFAGVEAATQSFVHALISDVLRRFGPQVLDRLLFKNCNQTLQKLIGLVVEYMQVADARSE